MPIRLLRLMLAAALCALRDRMRRAGRRRRLLPRQAGHPSWWASRPAAARACTPRRWPATWAGTCPARPTSSSSTCRAPAAWSPPTTSTTPPPRDGTVFGTASRTVGIEPLLGNKNARFDALKFNWIGTANVEYTTCIAWHTAPVKTLQDAKEKELIVAGTGAGATEVVFPRAANMLAGTKFKVVLGYPGSTEMLLSMERGETQGFCGIGWTFVKLRKGDWLRDKKINILFQISLQKHPELPDVPLIIDHARRPTTARCSSSCSRRRRWAGRSSRRPTCPPTASRRCARRSRRR